MPDVQSQDVIESQYAESIIAGNSASYDYIEIHGVRNLNEPGDPGTQYVVDDDNPQLYSVYLHCIGGGIECVGDFSTPAMAINYAEELSAVYQWPIANYGKCDE